MTALHHEQSTLGELIDLLKRRDPGQSIQFDFVHAVPTGRVESYRGYYEQLAIAYTHEPTDVFVRTMLDGLTEAVGKTFHGYKGGSYRMDCDTPLWVANYGECGDTAVAGLIDCAWITVIRTVWVP